MVVEVNNGSSVQAFGNSIPAGYGIPNIVASWIGGSVENCAIPDSGIKVINIYGFEYLPYGTRQKLVTWDGPLNDIRRHGAASLPCIAPALHSFLTCAFMGGSRPTSHQDVAKTGPWTVINISHNNYGTLKSQPHCGMSFVRGGTPMLASGLATASFTFTGPRVAIHAFGCETSGGNAPYQDINICVDGETSVLEVGGKALPGEATCGIATVIRGLSSGQHTVTVSTNGPGITAFDGFGFPQPQGFAPVVLAHVPYITDWLNATPSLIDQANAIIDGVANEWAEDGFPVAVARVNDNYDPARDSSDGIHPYLNGRKNYAVSQISQIVIK